MEGVGKGRSSNFLPLPSLLSIWSWCLEPAWGVLGTSMFLGEDIEMFAMEIWPWSV